MKIAAWMTFWFSLSAIVIIVILLSTHILKGDPSTWGILSFVVFGGLISWAAKKLREIKKKKNES